MLHELELKVIDYFQNLIPFSWSVLFKQLDFFDRQEFFFILIPIIWLGIDWKAGLKLFYIVFLSAFINHLLKNYFLSPRPFHLSPTIGIIQVSGFGFPSGAAQTVILLSGILIKFWKNPWKWVVVFTYVISVSFSRIYLGIHFPSDILGGWIVGFVLLFFYFKVFPFIEKQLRTLHLFSIVFLSQLIPWILFSQKISFLMNGLCVLASTLSLGLFISYRFHLLLPRSKNFQELIIRALVGIIGVFICFLLPSKILKFSGLNSLIAQMLLISAWLTIGSQLLCCKFLQHSLRQSN